MFAGLGIVMMLMATYGMFAWQLSLGRIEVLGAAGIFLVVAQFVRIERGTAEPAKPEPRKSRGGIDGLCRKTKEVQASLVLVHRYVRRLLQHAVRNGETNP